MSSEPATNGHMETGIGGHAPGGTRSRAVLIVGQGISTAGSQISNIAFIWLIVKLTGSAGSLAVVMTAMVLPNVIFTAMGGVYIDRLSPRVLLIGADVGRAAIMLSLAAVTLSGSDRLQWLIVAAVGLGLGQSIFDPALRATIATISKKEELLRVNSTLQIVNRGVGIVFPAVAGVLIVLIGVGGMLAIDGITFLLSAVSVALARLPRRQSNRARRTRVWTDMRAGLAYAFSRRYVRWLFVTAALINFADALVVIYPLFIRYVLHSGPAWYGLLNSAVMTGLFAVMLIFLIGGRRVPLRGALILGAGCQGIGLVAVAATGSRPISFAGFFFFGFGMGAFGAASITLLQRELPREFLGRVISLYGMSALVLMPVGYAVAGSLANVVGLSAIIEYAGLIMTSVAIALLITPRALAVKASPVPEQRTSTPT